MEDDQVFSLTSPQFSDRETRFTVYKNWIFRAVRWKWGCDPRWGGQEANQLWRLLQEMPQLGEKEFCLALKNILNSDDIPQMQRPGYWLPRLESYIVHPHNAYGRNPDATIPTAHIQRTQRSSNAIERVRENLRMADNPAKHISPEGIGSRRDRALGAGLRPVSDFGD